MIGGGVAGSLAAAATAAADGSVLLADEGRLGARTTDPAARDAIARLTAEARAAGAEILEEHAAIGIYEGPAAALLGPDELVEVEAEHVIVATGALEAHGVFPGNDLPGVWLGRGAARMAATHGVPIGERVVVVANTEEGAHLSEALRATGATSPSSAAACWKHAAREQVSLGHGAHARGPPCLRMRRARVVARLGAARHAPADDRRARGGRRGRRRAAGLHARRRGGVGTGRGARAGRDEPTEADLWPSPSTTDTSACARTSRCTTSSSAWDEGWTSSEILKRYTTATMGPCQGALCSRHLAEHARAKGAAPAARGRTTARPPVRAPRLGDLIGGVHEQVERRTALHDRHVAAGARIDHSGVWLRPGTYGDVGEEIRAVRERASMMDVSTLGKFLVAGVDARTLLDRVFPLDVGAVAPGRARYLLALDEAGYVMDDGLLAALGDGSYFVTSTSGGADRMEAWLRNWIDRLDLHVHLVNQTAQLGAINVAGPNARDLLATLTDDDLSRAAIPYPGHADIVVAGVPCRAIAVGFVGELSYELHHPRGRSEELWDALLAAGEPVGRPPARPGRARRAPAREGTRLSGAGHDAGRSPRETRARAGRWRSDKQAFVGKRALERMDALPLERRLVGLRFDGAPQRGHPLAVDGAIVGRITSCAVSEAAGGPVGLGWVRAVDGVFPDELTRRRRHGVRVADPFYDPEGVRLRA